MPLFQLIVTRREKAELKVTLEATSESHAKKRCKAFMAGRSPRALAVKFGKQWRRISETMEIDVIIDGIDGEE